MRFDNIAVEVQRVNLFQSQTFLFSIDRPIIDLFSLSILYAYMYHMPICTCYQTNLGIHI